MDLTPLLVLWLSHFALPSGVESTVPEGRFVFYENYQQIFTLTRQGEGFDLIPPPEAIGAEPLTFRIRPAGILTVGGEDLNLGDVFPGVTEPSSLGGALTLLCGAPESTPSCGATVDEALGSLEIRMPGARFHLVWREEGLNPEPDLAWMEQMEAMMGWENERDLPVDLASEGRTLELEVPATGRLDAENSAFRAVGGYPLHVWDLQLAPGQTVTIDLMSDEIDPYLYLTGGSLEEAIQNDDAMGTWNSQIVYTSDAGGRYFVVASAYDITSGPYTLRVQEGAPSGMFDGGDMDFEAAWAQMRQLPGDLTADGEPLSIGSTITSELRDQMGTFRTESGHLLEAWHLTLSAGEAIDLELRSDDFDAYLYLVPQTPGAPVLEDDDGAGGTDSRILYRSEAGGRYLVVVSSFGVGEAGVYRLRVSGGEPVVGSPPQPVW
jgi:redox-sensitive bicupin YhaK (pirin superfamily)